MVRVFSLFTHVSVKLTALSNFLALLERFLSSTMIVAFTLLLMVNVVSRYVFNLPLFAAEELALLILVWMGYISIAYSVSKQEQIGMGLVVDKLPERAKRITSIIVDIIMLAISTILLWSTFEWLNSTSVAYERAVALDVPKWPFFMVIPIFWGVLTIHLTSQLMSKLTKVD